MAGMKQRAARIFIAAAFAAALWLVPVSAYAQCEVAANADQAFEDMVEKMEEDYNALMKQTKRFIDLKLMKSARREINYRFEEFSDNIPKALSAFFTGEDFLAANNTGNTGNTQAGTPDSENLPEIGFLPNSKPQAKQMSASRMQETMEIGKQTDAKLSNDIKEEVNKEELKSNKRYTVNESTCALDSIAPAQTMTEQVSKALARAITLDNQPRILNAAPTGATPSGQGGGGPSYNQFAKDLAIASAQGPGPQQKLLIEEYKEFFCDPDRGDQGCNDPNGGSLKGRNTDLGGLLWGNKASVDFSSADTQRVKDAVLRTIVNPVALPPIPKDVVGTAKGGEEIVKRRAYAGRVAVVYNTLSQMLAERAEVPRPAGDETGQKAKEVRDATSGADPATSTASAQPGFREMQEAMTRDKFNSPDYVATLIASPTEITREQIASGAIRMQQMFDIYRRLEEMVFMEAAVYASDLDKRTPDAGYDKHNVRK
jgi:hypothetical protein